jgi:hypothetical protein
MAVGKNHAHDVPVATIFAVEIKSCLGTLSRREAIDNNYSRFSFDKSSIGKIEASDLVYTVNNFVKALFRDKLCLAPCIREDQPEM